MKLQIINNDDVKAVKSEQYNTAFSKIDGTFIRYGSTLDDDPFMAPAFEHLDWLISRKCLWNCDHCYQSNVYNGDTISLENFTQWFDKLHALNPIWCQVAYGIGSLECIPHLPEILHYTRSKGIIPNITIASHEVTALDNPIVSTNIDAIARYCGAMAISDYNVNDTLNLSRYLDELRQINTYHLKQINIHHMLCNETYDKAFTMMDKMHDNDNSHINAIVFLWMKEQGRAKSGSVTPITQHQFNDIVDYAFKHDISIGSDTCGAQAMISALTALDKLTPEIKQNVEQCCSTRFSVFLSVDGQFYPCSFCDYINGIHIDDIETFDDVWYSQQFNAFREQLKICHLHCPMYNIVGRDVS